MSLRDLTGRELNEWSGFSCACACGQKHVLETSFFIGAGVEADAGEAIKRVAPAGCGITLLYEQGYDTADLNRTLRHAGFVVHSRALPKRADFTALERERPGEDVRVVVGCGGGYIADCAKYVAAYMGLPCAVVVRAHSSASLLVPSAAICAGGMPQLFKTASPKVIVCDTENLPADSAYNAAAFGSVAARLLSLFDWKFASLIRGEKLCRAVYEAALCEIDGLLNRLKGVSREESGVREILLESGLRLSALGALSGSSRLFSGGEAGSALALEMLFAHEQRSCLFTGENEFLFAMLLFETYAKLFENGEELFLPPPDNNLRLEKLTEFFGAQESAALNSITPYMSEKRMELYEYRIEEYGGELKSELTMLRTRAAAAYKIFKRLHDDDGFALRRYLSPAEVKLCVALAPEMRAKFTALTHLKNMGVTDAYLLD